MTAKPAALTCGKCERPITEEESQWGWCPECAANDPKFLQSAVTAPIARGGAR